jgi:hypothetical protein
MLPFVRPPARFLAGYQNPQVLCSTCALRDAAALVCNPLDAETVAATIRITGGNFRLLNRLLTQIERILEITALREVTKAVVEARA